MAVYGGLINEILTDADKDQNLVIIDRDCDGFDESEVNIIEGKDAYIYSGIQSIKSNPERVRRIFAQAERTLERIPYMDPQGEFIKTSLDDYLDIQEIELTEEQKKKAYDSIQSWLGGLDEVIAESVDEALS